MHDRTFVISVRKSMILLNPGCRILLSDLTHKNGLIVNILMNEDSLHGFSWI